MGQLAECYVSCYEAVSEVYGYVDYEGCEDAANASAEVL